MRRRRLSSVPVIAFLLSFLVLLSPDLTLAPIQAVEPRVGPSRIDEVEDLRVPPRIPPAGRATVDHATGGDAPTGPAPVPATIDPARCQAALEAARAAAGAYGVTFAAVRDGEVLWTGSSGRARDGQTPLTPGSELVIGSVTKTYVAALILQLAEEGRVALDDPVRRHLPELARMTGEITVRQLLDHTSGLADVFNDRTRRGLEEHPERGWSVEQVLGSVREPWYRPGEGWAYANTNYYLLGLLAERVGGAALPNLLEGRLLGPLGLSATRMLTGTDPGEPLEPAWSTIFWASGAMTASAADVARWGDALYGDGVLSPRMRASMLELNDHDYGYGVQKIDVPGAPGYGHTGLLNTYTTLLYHLPEANVTIALLVNRSHVDLGGMLLVEAPNGGPSLLELARGDDG